MRISRTVTYAVQAILQLSEVPAGRPVPCGRLASEGRMPERFLLQVLRSLVRTNILSSVRGVTGGYELSRRPEEITLLDVFEAFDSLARPSIPPLEGIPDASLKTLQAALDRVDSSTRAELSRVTIADLSSGKPPQLFDGDEATV